MAWAQTGPTQRPGGGNWSRAPGETAQDGLVAAACPLLAWCSWALASRWARPSGQGAGRRCGARPAVVHRGAGGPWPGCWWTRAISPFPPPRFMVHRAHPGALPSPLFPCFPFPRRRWTARRSGGAPVLHPTFPPCSPTLSSASKSFSATRLRMALFSISPYRQRRNGALRRGGVGHGGRAAVPRFQLFRALF